MSEPAPAVLVLNAGSSSIKGSLHRGDGRRRTVQADLCARETRLTASETSTEPMATPCVEVLSSTGEDRWAVALAGILDRLCEETSAGAIAAVGHRVVHGGREFAAPVVITPAVRATLESLTPLAPLHQPHGLAAIHAATERLPRVPQVACFDTAFHRTCPEVARRCGLPREWHDRGIERYGFHGLSYQSIVEQLPALVGHLPRRLVVAHLGAGASMAAVLDGQSVATTMGFTPLDGLLMSTRCGSLDPGVVVHLAEGYELSPKEIGRILSKESGLLGVSGISGDMRELLGSDAPEARDAVDLFCYRAITAVGSLAAALGGLDAIVFTAGIGERGAAIRERMCQRLGWLGLDFDPQANQSHGPRISRESSRVAAWVIATDEAAVIARSTRLALARLGG
jgi:acetate kinase